MAVGRGSYLKHKTPNIKKPLHPNQLGQFLRSLVAQPMNSFARSSRLFSSLVFCLSLSLTHSLSQSVSRSVGRSVGRSVSQSVSQSLSLSLSFFLPSFLSFCLSSPSLSLSLSRLQDWTWNFILLVTVHAQPYVLLYSTVHPRCTILF